MNHYVYVGKMNGETVYVGKGCGLRYTHLNSGRSSCYRANQSHFNGELIDVEIVKRFEFSKDALDYEKYLIETCNPKWNIKRKGMPIKQSRGIREYRGVQFIKSKPSKQWRAYTHVNKVKVHIGYFETENEAKEARDSYHS